MEKHTTWDGELGRRTPEWLTDMEQEGTCASPHRRDLIRVFPVQLLQLQDELDNKIITTIIMIYYVRATAPATDRERERERK